MEKINEYLLKEVEKKDLNKYFGNWISNETYIDELSNKFYSSKPYSHIVIDDFLSEEYIDNISLEFPKKYDNWYKYYNPLEVKYAYDNINNLDENIKHFFYILSSKQVTNIFSKITNIDLEYDPYLHGAGLHAHPKYGRLNIHLDYEKHPYLQNKQRRLNVILFLNKKWDKSWNGDNQLWNEDVTQCQVSTYPNYNRAIIFQTNEKSWHGLPDKINCPKNIYRKSLAFYYISNLCNPKSDKKFGDNGTGYRQKAAYTHRPNDITNPMLKKLYEIRPYRRITNYDMEIIWKKWNPIDY